MVLGVVLPSPVRMVFEGPAFPTCSPPASMSSPSSAWPATPRPPRRHATTAGASQPNELQHKRLRSRQHCPWSKLTATLSGRLRR